MRIFGRAAAIVEPAPIPSPTPPELPARERRRCHPHAFQRAAQKPVAAAGAAPRAMSPRIGETRSHAPPPLPEGLGAPGDMGLHADFNQPCDR